MAAFVAAAVPASRRLVPTTTRRLPSAAPALRPDVPPLRQRRRAAAVPLSTRGGATTMAAAPPSGASATAAPAAGVAPPGGTPPLTYTSLDGNSFVLSAGPVDAPTTRLFIDPWLVGELKFLPAIPNFFTATKAAIDKNTDVASYGRMDGVVLTQSLPDHLHEPTLMRLDKGTPVLAPPSAEGALADLGFTDVTIVRPGEGVTFCGVAVEATTGSLVGPPWQDPENGYIFDFGGGDASSRLYYEPHGNHADDVMARVKAVGVATMVTPVKAVALKGIGYKLVNGDDAQPAAVSMGVSTVVVLENTNTKGMGILNKAIGVSGSVDEFKASLGKDVRVVVPKVATPEVLCEGDQ